MSVLKTGRPSKKKAKLIDEVNQAPQETVRINFNISKEAHKKLKQKALDKDTTITQLFLDALEKIVSK